MFLLGVGARRAALQAYLAKAPQLLATPERVQLLFEIVRGLCAQRASCSNGLDLLARLLVALPREAYQPFLPTTMEILVVLTEVSEREAGEVEGAYEGGEGRRAACAGGADGAA